MSVPLDRLYNFLHDVCNHQDLIIYRFFPHGSRKIEDLTLLDYCEQTVSPGVSMVLNDKTFLFFHDQEPLNFDIYQLNSTTRPSILPMITEELTNKFNNIIERMMPEMNIRWAAGIYLWRFPILLAHSEKRSKELIKYENIKFIGVYWWCHALIARDWFRYAERDLKLLQPNPTKDFLIYNRAWSGTREYRLKFIELLVENNIDNHCMTWFNPFDDGKHYTKLEFKNSMLEIKTFNLENYFSPTQADSNASADYHCADYQQTRIEVVLETLFDDTRLHLTEKILRPIACGHPFMLASTHESLEYLRSYGFKTFHPWINEAYDTITDPLQRLKAIVQEMKRITNLSEDEKNLLYFELKNISEYNKQLFFSDKWQDYIINEFKINFDQALLKVNSI